MRAKYVLVTAAHNEEQFIANTIISIIEQEWHPTEWIIVSDGSTDQTDHIVNNYAAHFHFIHLLRIANAHPRNFAAQVNAINFGIRHLKSKDFDYFGNLDADITVAPSYFRRLSEKFECNPQLGLGGGAICERSANGHFKPRKWNSVDSVAHACQFFRSSCFKAIGGCYFPMPYGAPDVYAEVAARMNSWQVRSFTDLPVYHHRFTGSADHFLRNYFRQGKADYSLGTLPFFELARVLRRSLDISYGVGSLVRLAGFGYSYLSREPRPVSRSFVAYVRKEQAQRLTRLVWASHD